MSNEDKSVISAQDVTKVVVTLCGISGLALGLYYYGKQRQELQSITAQNSQLKDMLADSEAGSTARVKAVEDRARREKASLELELMLQRQEVEEARLRHTPQSSREASRDLDENDQGSESELNQSFATSLNDTASARQKIQRRREQAMEEQRRRTSLLNQTIPEGEENTSSHNSGQSSRRNSNQVGGTSSGSKTLTGWQPRAGVVYLVGAGPGAVDLITVRGLEVLRASDVVIHDRLVLTTLMDVCRPGTTFVNVGKASAKERFSQREINNIMIKEARGSAPRVVVRLKGGDPFVFGQGGEECEALTRAGIPYEVIPGLSSATSISSWVGIPLTQKGLSTGFSVVSGHIAPSKHGPEEWQHLSPSQTLIVLMGNTYLREIVTHLTENLGFAKDTAAALIESGTTPAQRTLIAPLHSLCEQARAQTIVSPSLLVVGPVVGFYRTNMTKGVNVLDFIENLQSQSEQTMPSEPREAQVAKEDGRPSAGWGVAREPTSSQPN